jgi:FtsH-binding integral membrane protein
MGPNELYKRRHYGTPQSVMLLLTNYLVFGISTALFATDKTINWFFWVCVGALVVHNFFNIRKDREEYNRFRIIAYVVSILLMAVMFVLFRLKA